MLLKKRLLESSKLYLILDRDVNSYDELFDIAKKALTAGIKILQLRDKNGSARDILDFSRKILKISRKKAFFIINDRVDLAKVSGSLGVHIEQEDIPYEMARKLLGKKAAIGVSCQTLKQAKEAEKQGADYIGFGSVFETKTKPERSPMDLKLLKKVLSKVKIPVYAIGGISLKNIGKLKRISVDKVAVCRDICCDKNVVKKISLFKKELSGI